MYGQPACEGQAERDPDSHQLQGNRGSRFGIQASLATLAPASRGTNDRQRCHECDAGKRRRTRAYRHEQVC